MSLPRISHVASASIHMNYPVLRNVSEVSFCTFGQPDNPFTSLFLVCECVRACVCVRSMPTHAVCYISMIMRRFPVLPPLPSPSLHSQTRGEGDALIQPHRVVFPPHTLSSVTLRSAHRAFFLLVFLTLDCQTLGGDGAFLTPHVNVFCPIKGSGETSAPPTRNNNKGHDSRPL